MCVCVCVCVCWGGDQKTVTSKVLTTLREAEAPNQPFKTRYKIPVNMFHWTKEKTEGLFISQNTQPRAVDLNSHGNTIPEEGDSPFSHPLLTEQKEMASGCCEKRLF